jgi:nucleoside 2-deoxyribosyltransferase
MKNNPVVYLIGSLRNAAVPALAARLREIGCEVFDDWHAAGPHADDEWKRYEQERGNNYQQALEGYAARHVFEFDLHHLERCDTVILVLPAGKSGHLEFGWALGKDKIGYVLFDHPCDDPETRWDVMYQFADRVFFNPEDLMEKLK